jgi:hypothetical protein
MQKSKHSFAEKQKHEKANATGLPPIICFRNLSINTPGYQNNKTKTM